MKEHDKRLESDSNVDAITEQARKSGLSYNEAKEWIAKTTGGRDTHVFSDTNVKAVKAQNEQSETNRSQNS